MEENFPGNLTADVTISWDDDCNLTFHYQATTDKATVINMTNHTYFYLAGYDHGTVRDHAIYIDSDVVTAVDSGLIPTGGYMLSAKRRLTCARRCSSATGLTA